MLGVLPKRPIGAITAGGVATDVTFVNEDDHELDDHDDDDQHDNDHDFQV